MVSPWKRSPAALVAALPTLFVCAVLAGVGYWGAATGWRATRFADTFPALAELLGMSDGEAAAEKKDDKPGDVPAAEKSEGSPDWCEKHETPDSLCTACHPELAATSGAAASPAGEVPIQPSHDARQCRTHHELIGFPSTEAVGLAGVKTAAATIRSLAETVSAYGVVEFDEFQTAKLAPRAAGTVWASYKRLGEKVRAGDLLALVDAAEVGKSKAEYLQAVVQLDSRVKARAALQPDRVPERVLQEADAGMREARARMFTAQQALLNLGLPLRGDEATLPDDQLRGRLQFLGIPDGTAKLLPPAATTANLLPVLAPFAGTVVDGKAVKGESVAAQQPLFTISDLGSVHVLLDFRPEDAPRLAVGQRVEFRPDGDAGPPAIGELHWISPAVDEKTRMVHAHAEVPNPAGRLRANSFGTAAVTIRSHDAALVVPGDAVQWEGCSYVVFAAESPTAFRPRKVRLGLRQDGVVEILVGLRRGDAVATAGSHVLKSYLFRDRLGGADD
jgi:cobalt-zinc-cadmium efflux system membrane fusion protein